MDALEYLSERHKKAFSRWHPVYFEEEGVPCIAHLARHSVLDLDLAIIEMGDDVTYYGCFENFSLKNYKGVLVPSLVEELSCVMKRSEGRVDDLNDLNEKIISSLELDVY